MLLKNATLLDVNHKMTPGYSVLIVDNKIKRVADGEIKVDDNVQIIDVQGKTLMPGLIDAHIHLGIPSMTFSEVSAEPISYKSIYAAKMAELMIKQGFTTVRDACGIDVGINKAIERGLIKGPRTFFADKMITKTGGHGDCRHQHEIMDTCGCHALPGECHIVADGVAAVRKATREVLRRGAHQIKIATSGGVITERNSVHAAAFSPEEVKAIVEEAADGESYVMAHAHGHEGIRRAVENGVRSIEHCSYLTEELAELMKVHGTYMMPTVFIARELTLDKSLPEAVRVKGQAVTEAMLRSIELGRKYHLKIGFGSDAFGEPIPRHAEEFLIRAKVEDPYEVIIAATATNAEMMQQTDKLGVIKENAFADLIIVDGDPLKDISLLADPKGIPITLVIKDGKIVKN
jgi:imidazolonepropionase-like amidohydrolase